MSKQWYMYEKKNGVVFPDNFFRWLSENEAIYDAFRVKALQMARTGRKRYSARAIIHAIRWETDLQDSDTTFKVNNNYTPGMARLFMLQYGNLYPGFFQMRDSLGLDQ